MAKRKPKKNTIKETDLYRPVRDYLLAQGYTVRAEVHDCDVTATKDGELIVIELKTSFNLDLLLQATTRQRAADSVYVAIPRPASLARRTGWQGMKHVLRRLELGLILVNLDAAEPTLEIVFHPLPYERKKIRAKKRAILHEISQRSGDFNEGGSNRRALMTAYREAAIRVACALEQLGPMSPRALRELGSGAKTLSILASNYYGWFERVERGVYALKASGAADLAKYPELAQRYRLDLEARLTEK
jgi:hypothetical protein